MLLMRQMAVKLRQKCLLEFILKTRNKQEHFSVTLTSGMIDLKCMTSSLQKIYTLKIWEYSVSMKKGNMYV